MAEIDVVYYSIDTFECLRSKTHVLKLLELAENGHEIGFAIRPDVFANVSKGRAIHALILFLGMFRECGRLFFSDLRDKVLIGNIVTALKGFDRIEYGLADFCFRRNCPEPALEIDDVMFMLEYRINNCKYSKERKSIRESHKPHAFLVGISSMAESDPTAAFALNWATPPEQTRRIVTASDWQSIPYPEQNDIMWTYLRNDDGHVCETFYEFDKDHTIQNIGFVALHAIKHAFAFPERSSPGIVQNVIRTWLHACIDMYTNADERMPGGDRLHIPVPKTPINTTDDVADYLIDLLSDLTYFIVSNSTLLAVQEEFGSWPKYFECADVFAKHGEPLLASIVSMRNFISPEDAMEGFAHFYANAAFAQLFIDACEDDFEGILKVYENLSDADIAARILTPEVYDTARWAFRHVVSSVVLHDMPPPPELPVVVDLSVDASMACLFARRIVRQMPEYSRPELAAARHIFDLPFVVQGEAFVLPMASTVHAPLARALRFDAYTRLTCAACPAPGDSVVQLVSQFCIFNKPGERQHDYLYFHPRWEFGDYDEPPGTPDVYTGIINLSYANMEFRKTSVGRSAPLASVKTAGGRRKTRHENKKAAAAGECEDRTITLQPGQMLVYKREPAESDERGMISWQCRLSATMEAAETGVPYMQVSIAVYRGGATNDAELDQLAESVQIMETCGVMKNHIYAGKQGWEKARTRASKKKEPLSRAKSGLPPRSALVRRSLYPILYSQLTNASKNNTRKLFYENRMYLQRNKLLGSVWAQTVLLVYDETIDQERLVTPRSGVTFNEEIGYLPEVQRMTFGDILEVSQSLIKPVSNFSVGTTQKIVDDIYARVGEAEKHADVIYSNNPPPLRNLHGFLKCRSDHYLTSMKAPTWELNLFGLALLKKKFFMKHQQK